MVYESEFYTRRPYTSTYTSTRPTISSYTLTTNRYFDDDYYTPSYYTPSHYTPSYFASTYRYHSPISPISVIPHYSRIGSYYRPSFRFSYDADDYPTEIGYSTASSKRFVPLPITRVTTSPSRVYRDVSPVRLINTPTRYYRRDAYSPVRVITSPTRIISNRVRPSLLTREFDRIDRKFRARSLEYDATDEWLNSPYTSTFNDETRDIRANTNRLLREVNEPVPRPQYKKQYTWNRFDDNENELYVQKNILRPTRNTSDQIKILSTIKYRDVPKRFGKSKKDDASDNKPLVVVKPSVMIDEKISTVIDSSTLETKEEEKA